MEAEDEAAGEVEERSTPVTIVTGFLGSGKTTLLKHILSGDHGKKIAVIQNELAAETGIEAPGAQGVTGPSGEVFADWIELANGCVCCSVRDDLVSALEVLVKKVGFDQILIETTGLADPGPLASIFWLDDALGSALALDAVVTVVDSKYCMQHLNEQKKLGEVNECARQIAFADRLILNKQDLVSQADMEDLLLRVRSINPAAPLFQSQHSKVPLDAILGIQAFDLESAAQLLALTGEGQSAASGHGHGHGHGHGEESSSGTDCATCKDAEDERRRRLGEKHGDSVGAVTVTLDGEVELERFRQWLGNFLWEDQPRLGMETYRYKGLLSIRGETAQYVLQGVHDTFELEPGPTVKPASGAKSKLVFIGKSLDEAFLREQLKPLASPVGA